MVSFPEMRLRRVRELEPVRVLTRETRLSPSSFIYPLFVAGPRSRRPGLWNGESSGHRPRHG